MKYKFDLIFISVFLIIVYTAYFWESWLSIFAFPAYMFLVVVYMVIALRLLGNLIKAGKEKFRNRQRLSLMLTAVLVLVLTFFYPVISSHFEGFHSGIVFRAGRSGAAGCHIEFRLKEDKTFTERNVCFGVTETSGEYEVKGDTIFFNNVDLARFESNYYKFGVIKNSAFANANISAALVRYMNMEDTVGHEIWITQNELGK